MMMSMKSMIMISMRPIGVPFMIISVNDLDDVHDDSDNVHYNDYNDDNDGCKGFDNNNELNSKLSLEVSISYVC